METPHRNINPIKPEELSREELIDLVNRLVPDSPLGNHISSANDLDIYSEEEFRLTLSNVSDAVFITDKDGNFTFICPNVNVIFGYNQSDVRELAKIENILGSRLCDYNEVKIKGEIENIEHSIIDKQGRNHILLVNVKKVDIHGGKILYTCRDITERKKYELALEESKNHLRNLTIHFENSREEEKKKLSFEIHDSLGYVFTALKMDLSWCRDKFKTGNPKMLEKIDDMQSLINNSIQVLRNICSDIRPPMLDHFGLNAALEWQAKEIEKRSGISFRLDITDDEIGLTENESTMVFRIYQEALTNVMRHSNASHVDIKLKKYTQFCELNIIDDGIGISEEQINNTNSFGILGMKERAGFIGGKVDFKNAEGGGTAITILIPIN